ncbi:Methyltransferase domain-containing protein [Formosa sp. Hel1_31_208]|uniref:methyltransferase domain-containing protein n=1 Tax=Formosa sp. Hel1_31_208 TaxID=1798225 RepID=UPI00087B37FF|nr:methyltransferase domain-containing protein [Formosa sp. Hel1_31_208]SDS69424.1 Methyltransferase domain-containing protein [Formosa sp. Hel1_31_208]
MLKKFKYYIKKKFRKTPSGQNAQIAKSKYCPVCDEQVIISPFLYEYYFGKFFEHGFVYSPFLFETLNLKYYKCDNCGASDRERLIALFIKKHIGNKDNSLKLLDLAPAKSLSKFISRLKNINYRTADLFMDNVDDIVDIKDMHIYDNNSFDMFICSHVLEHIDDDLKAMSELHRILKKNGVGILLVPILLSIEKSVENEEYLESEHLRWKYFGQDDHVRMYSKFDFTQRLKESGFHVEQLGVDYFSKTVFENSGIDMKSVLYVVRPE